MERAFIFGAGATGKRILDNQSKYEIIGLIDNDEKKWWTIGINNLKIYPPEHLKRADFDKVIIGSLSAYYPLIDQLKNMGIDDTKIEGTLIDVNIDIKARIVFMKQLTKIYSNLPSNICVAEAGVFQGEFAKDINKEFYNRKLYLFDTFEGFDVKDIEFEDSVKNDYFQTNHFSTTSEAIVMSKMKYPENCIIRKGRFPKTTDGLEDKQFCFVNLDMDLYKPTLEGLRFFYPRMVKGGCILIHDYFSDTYPRVRSAVSDFENEMGTALHKIPIGDSLSLAISI